MIVDLNLKELPRTEYDICIAGSGPAGITLALKLANSKMKVLLVEGGALSYTEESQSLYNCGSTGLEAWPNQMRLRYFGGTSNHWAGRCRPFNEIDFINKDHNGIPGWPIRYSDIEPYLAEAMEIVDLPGEGFIADGDYSLGKRFVSDAYAQSPPTRFGEKYLDLFSRSENITVALNANVKSLEFDSNSNQVSSLTAVNYLEGNYKLFAGIFIIAMGGIENARFLLNQADEFEHVLENPTEMLGQCFMEHLNVKLGEYIVEDSDDVDSFQFYTTSGMQTDFNIGGGNASFNVLSDIKSYGRTARIKTFFKTIACDLGIEEKVNFIADFDCPGTGAITTLIEQSPGKHSYIKLIDERDKLGLRNCQLNWELSKGDLNTIRTIAIELAKSFADTGLGLVKLEDYILDESYEIPVSQHAHHMGTTRMADSSKFGVVDRNCKVFGTENLYIAGSSIFSTGGACNPTMPIIQFALRLADHIQHNLGENTAA